MMGSSGNLTSRFIGCRILLVLIGMTFSYALQNDIVILLDGQAKITNLKDVEIHLQFPLIPLFNSPMHFTNCIYPVVII